MTNTPLALHISKAEINQLPMRQYDGPIHLAKVLGWPVRSADLVIANSNATADFIQAATHRHLRIEVAYNGIPVPEASPTFGPGGTPVCPSRSSTSAATSSS